MAREFKPLSPGELAIYLGLKAKTDAFQISARDFGIFLDLNTRYLKNL